MNGKFEDKLAQLAFGDLTPEEANRIEIEAKSNPDAARALDTYRRMRDGLRDLSAVPEDQLSKERLKNAILMHGLKPAPERKSTWGWLWMPTTACLLAAALMMFKGQPTGEPSVVLGEAPERAAGNLVFKEPALAAPTDDIEWMPLPAQAGTTNSPVEQPRVVRKKRPRRSTVVERQDQVVSRDEPRTTTVAVNERPVAPTISTGDVSSLEESRPVPRSSAPIVLIDETSEAATGAFRATEVGSASNVLIGG